MIIERRLSEIRGFLAVKQLPSGGWPALVESSQTALEPTIYSMLVLEDRPEYEVARHCLRQGQNPNGSWPAFLGDDQQGAWVTALALIALGKKLDDIPCRRKGANWLLRSAGKESNWFWKWKFRTTDRQVRFNPNKFGWPWLPDTNSWVVPTAFAIVALHQLSSFCSAEISRWRVQLGQEMLLDRLCPGGGWNAGNGVVYGVPLAAHADDTAVALLGLKDRADQPAVLQSLGWLERVAPTLPSAWSLAWSLLTLAAYSRNVESLAESLAKSITTTDIQDIATLAVSALALDHAHSVTFFGT